MRNERKTQGIFISFVFTWSFLLWITSIYISVKFNIVLLENFELMKLVLDGNLSDKILTVTILNTLAGYGPLFGTILICLFIPKTRDYFKGIFKSKVSIKYILQVIALFLVVSVVPILPLVIKNGFDIGLFKSLIIYLLVFFIYQFITAGTEEIAWRGYLLPSMLKKKTPWQASVRIGIIWALWHTPIIMYVFFAQGLPIYLIIISFLGYIAGTIAMSTIHTFYYLKTNNLLFNMFIHALANTLPMFVGVLFASSYEVSVAVQISLWVFVFIITKKHKELFDTVIS